MRDVRGTSILFCAGLPILISIALFGNEIVDFSRKYSINKELRTNHVSSEWGYLRELGGFAAQAQHLVHRTRLSRTAARQFYVLLSAVRHELSKVWPDLRITPFGSAVQGLALGASSDIDVFVSLPDMKDTSYNASDLVLRAADVFNKNNSYIKIRTIVNVEVPIIRFTYTPTNQRCDISFRIRDDHGNSALIKYLFKIDNRALDLMIIIKNWAKLNNVQVNFFIPNLTWYFLIIFYLQQINILPAVHVLQKTAKPEIVNYWNFAFNEPFEYLYPSENEDSLYDILGGFFLYYDSFDFERNCISVFAGIPIPQNCFDSVKTVPEIFELYKHNVRNNTSEPMKTGTLFCVQRVFNHNENIGQRIGPALSARVKESIHSAANVFRTTSERDFLPALLTNKKSLQNFNQTTVQRNINTETIL